MISRTATTRLVADILDLLDRDWIAWANVLELLAYASGLKPVVRLVADAANREILADFCQRQHWPWRWSGFWLEPVFHTPLNDTFTRLVYGHAPQLQPSPVRGSRCRYPPRRGTGEHGGPDGGPRTGRALRLL